MAAQTPNLHMTDDNKNNIPIENEDSTPETNDSAPVNQTPNRPPEPPADDYEVVEDDMGNRLERLGGEPAPVITPEEFARLQKAGQVHIDSRGRVRTASRSGPNAGVSLRKRRAWYV